MAEFGQNFRRMLDNYRELRRAGLGANESLQAVYLAVCCIGYDVPAPPALVPEPQDGHGQARTDTDSEAAALRRENRKLQKRIDDLREINVALTDRVVELEAGQAEIRLVPFRVEMESAGVARVEAAGGDGNGAPEPPAADAPGPPAPGPLSAGGEGEEAAEYPRDRSGGRRGLSTTPLTPAEQRRLRELLEQGLSGSEVARRMGIAQNTVYRYSKRMQEAV